MINETRYGGVKPAYIALGLGHYNHVLVGETVSRNT